MLKLEGIENEDEKKICGVVEIINGKSWICIKEEHAPVYKRRSGRTRYGLGGSVVSNNPSAYAHYFVRRYPNGNH